MMTTATAHINGVDTDALQQTIREVKGDPKKGIARFSARTAWKGGFASESTISGWNLGGEKIPHNFTIRMDEPRELLGQDAHANPQEFLQSAMNACMLNTFVAVCSMLGVKLQSVEFESTGELDLRGFLGIDSRIPAGYKDINYTIRVKGDGTREQYEKAHEAMMATSPNYYNMAKPIRLNAKLIVE
jgi:uncharacterized OsmC-like protein